MYLDSLCMHKKKSPKAPFLMVPYAGDLIVFGVNVRKAEGLYVEKSLRREFYVGNDGQGEKA